MKFSEISSKKGFSKQLIWTFQNCITYFEEGTLK